MIKQAVLAAVLTAASGVSAFAASADVTVSADKRVVYAGAHTARQAGVKYHLPPAAGVIYSNLAAKYPDGLYFSGEGDTLSGPTSALGQQYWIAGAFTPTKSAKAMSVTAAIGYIEGTDGITISIYPDAGGVPGNTPLASAVATNLPTFGNCCGLATATFSSGVKLTAGTQYWVAATTDSSQSTTFAAWNLATVDQIDTANVAANDGGGWSAFSTTLPPSFSVNK